MKPWKSPDPNEFPAGFFFPEIVGVTEEKMVCVMDTLNKFCSLSGQEKASSLLFAGQTILAKSVLEAIPIYPMMTNLLPKACIKEIQKMQRNFIWGDTTSSKKLHDVNWNIVTTLKDHDGLGLKDLGAMNAVCIMKLSWKLINDAEDLWCNMLKGIYKEVHLCKNPIKKTI
ncbi:unnamed protein product [Lathyrus sativus]|nr:unnamed protein product [Lathyrus sativus]